MKNLSRIVFMLMLLSCTSKKDKANEYYDRFSAIIVPYKEGTESILTEMQTLLQKQMKSSGNFKLSREDSLTQQTQIRQFESLTKKTLNDLDSLEDFQDSKLKTAGMDYVKASSSAVLGAFREIAIPMQQPGGLDQQALDSLSDKYSNDLV